MRPRWLTVVLLLSLGPVFAAPAEDLLVLPFDDSLVGENGETPTLSSNIGFESGANGQAAWFPSPSELYYSSAENIDETSGTFECWMKPAWNGNDGQSHHLLRFGSGGGMLIGKDGANNLRIILNRYGVHPGGEFGIFTNIGNWVAGEWHHVAFTWSDATKELQVYVDGVRRGSNSFSASLPDITDTSFQIGADGGGSYAQATVDSLRLSAGVRTSDEITAHMNAGLTIHDWWLNDTGPAELWPGWHWWIEPTITAVTGAGEMTMPMSTATWVTSDPHVAVFDETRSRIKATGPGSAVLTGTIGDRDNTIDVNVVTPARPPEEPPIDPFLSTPVDDSLYRMPVVILRYFPTSDGVSLDAGMTGQSTALVDMETKGEHVDRRKKFMLEEGSRFRGYGNPAAAPALGYEVLRIVNIYEDVPPGFPAWHLGEYFPDYNQILERFDAEWWVREHGVKEFWIWHQHYGRIAPNESNMSSPTTGDISNSARTNDDQPVFDRTYMTYGVTLSRTSNEAVHNHGHQFEAILSYANRAQDGNDDLFWESFVGQNSSGQFQQGRCGDTHHPPNAVQDYDYWNMAPAWSDIEDWYPEGGGTQKEVNADTWGDIPYPWPYDDAPNDSVQAQWYIYWMQAMPGRDNGIPYAANTMSDWWQFTAAWDPAAGTVLGMYRPSTCSETLSTVSESFDSCGGTVNIDVTSTSGCRWIASSNHPWLEIAGAWGGNGSGTISVDVGINDGPARDGSVVIAGQMVEFAQAASGGGAPGEVPSLIVSGSSVTQLSWPAVTGADYYDVARGTLDQLADGSYGSCFADDLVATSTTDAEVPVPGVGHFYVVRGVSASFCAAGIYGHDSGGAPRDNRDFDRCP